MTDPILLSRDPEGVGGDLTETEREKAVPLLRPALKVADRLSPNRRARPHGAVVNLIVVHYDESDRSAQTLVEMLSRDSKKSYHALVSRDSTMVYRIVPADERADHAGVSAFPDSTTYSPGKGGTSVPCVNDHSLGLSLTNNGHQDYPADQLQIAAAWCAYAMKKYPAITLDRIVGHCDVALPKGRKIDPGAQFPWEHFRYLVQLEVAALATQP